MAVAPTAPAGRSSEFSSPTGDNRRHQGSQEQLAALGRSDLELGVLAACGHPELEERAALALGRNEGLDALTLAVEAQQRPAVTCFHADERPVAELANRHGASPAVAAAQRAGDRHLCGHLEPPSVGRGYLRP